MEVLVVGSGGREHALAYKIAQSPVLTKLYVAPGNAGTRQHGETVAIGADDVAGLVDFAAKERIELVVVGPEAPLVAGLVDALEARGIKAFGPSQKAAELEGSKVFMKKLMRGFSVPTAPFQVFNDYEGACAHVATRPLPLVVKADGLAAGKGVLVCRSKGEALDALRVTMKDRKFGDAGAQVVIEDCLEGEEASILALCDGKTIYPLETSQDHKAVFDGDKGPNTGGMGAYSPAPVITNKLMDSIERDILVPTMHGMSHERRGYKGVLYAGLMKCEEGLSVLEYNCRFGDPETQPLLMRLKSDLLPALVAVVEEKLEEAVLEWDPRPAVCVVMASQGYPGSYPKGLVIEGIDEAEKADDVKVFHAGTALDDGKVVTSGGRVLGVTALGETIAKARDAAYEAVNKIHFKGAHFRTDIAHRALSR